MKKNTRLIIIKLFKTWEKLFLKSHPKRPMYRRKRKVLQETSHQKQS